MYDISRQHTRTTHKKSSKHFKAHKIQSIKDNNNGERRTMMRSSWVGNKLTSSLILISFTFLSMKGRYKVFDKSLFASGLVHVRHTCDKSTLSQPLLRRRVRLFASDSFSEPQPTEVKNIAIIGGGLAGLSTAYHLIENSKKLNRNIPSITIFDKNEPGTGGASSVAGGLLHPFSPRGKLIYRGKESLHVSSSLIEQALKYEPCVLRSRLFRIAMTERNVDELQKTASLHPNLATWLSPAEIESHCGSSTRSLGGVLLSNGCKLIHVPSYLKGLWNTCKHESDSSATWTIVDDDSMKGQEWEDKLRQFDTVVYSAGSGLFTDAILKEKSLPISLVRGQSLEMTLEGTIADKSQFSNEALLCGKYIAPLNDTNKVLIGATHEFQEEAINNDQVVEELRSRSYNLSTFVWDNAKIDKITTGFRVQSQRGAYGRMPIIGKISESEKVHPNSWIFTGLSARGLIYHGYFGNVLSSAILSSDESEILQSIPEALWWQCEKL